MARLTRLHSPRRALVAVALLALLLAQMLGLVHRVVHTHAAAASSVAWSHTGAAGDDGDADWVHRLFGDHHGGSDCGSYDKLTSCDAVGSAAPAALPQWAGGSVPMRHVAWHLAAQAAGFLARGPPATR